MTASVPQLVALLDGSLVDVDTPLLRADDLGVVRGDGVFDVASCRNGRVTDLEAHLERLATSAHILSLPEPDLAGYARAVDALVDAWDWEAHPEATVRLVETRGPEHGGEPTCWAMMQPVPDSVRREREGVRVVVLDRGHEAEETSELPWLLPGAKSLSYGINMAAKRWAKAHGADDAIFVTPSGLLLEGPTSALVVDLDGELVTPRQDGILPSTTLRTLVDAAPEAGLQVRFAHLQREALAGVRGAWLLSSGRILAPIVSIDGAELPISPLHPTLRKLLAVPGA
ncbi:aminotransferase class IV [Gulosibacter faecalis]|jgi:4-amino-4-deoxychorismate lyase|uniref:Aminotransferase class IV n=1 Tax=Gulosibacter faecalis TaxID=272240 RepID=A0ABW5UUI7_9MICO|nr:aminotransferase class IV [Gulosibacter faecalis]